MYWENNECAFETLFKYFSAKTLGGRRKFGSNKNILNLLSWFEIHALCYCLRQHCS
jgi:hypothetical protein